MCIAATDEHINTLQTQSVVIHICIIIIVPHYRQVKREKKSKIEIGKIGTSVLCLLLPAKRCLL